MIPAQVRTELLRDLQLPAERFDVGRMIGHGGFGVVFEAVERDSGRRVALKVLFPYRVTSADARRRFAFEASVLASITNESIPKAIAWGLEGNTPYLAMELIEAPSLADIIQEHTRLGQPCSLDRAVAFARRLASALNEIHQLGIVHRDLKPKNILVSALDVDNCSLKLVDFGIAKSLDPTVDPTTFGRTLGSALYMAPEQVRGEAVGAFTDAFAFGTLLFELLTNCHPWLRDGSNRPRPRGIKGARVTPEQLLRATELICVGARPSLRDLRPAIPVGVEEAILMAMNIDPSRRISPSDLVAAMHLSLGTTDPTRVGRQDSSSTLETRRPESPGVTIVTNGELGPTIVVPPPITMPSTEPPSSDSALSVMPSLTIRLKRGVSQIHPLALAALGLVLFSLGFLVGDRRTMVEAANTARRVEGAPVPVEVDRPSPTIDSAAQVETEPKPEVEGARPVPAKTKASPDTKVRADRRVVSTRGTVAAAWRNQLESRNRAPEAIVEVSESVIAATAELPESSRPPIRRMAQQAALRFDAVALLQAIDRFESALQN